MAINFIKNVFEKKIDSFTHHAFVRYSVGEFNKEPLSINVGNSIKLQGGFEYVNVFERIFAKLAAPQISVKGSIPTTMDISEQLKNLGLDFEENRRFGKKGTLYTVSGSAAPEKLSKFFEEIIGCFFLLDLSAGSLKLKVKKKETPKIGSPTDKFVTLTLPKEYLKDVISEFLFDIKIDSFKNVEILHKYKIETIDVDQNLVNEDPLKAREQAVRKGRIERIVNIDGKEHKSEIMLNA